MLHWTHQIFVLIISWHMLIFRFFSQIPFLDIALPFQVAFWCPLIISVVDLALEAKINRHLFLTERRWRRSTWGSIERGWPPFTIGLLEQISRASVAWARTSLEGRMSVHLAVLFELNFARSEHQPSKVDLDCDMVSFLNKGRCKLEDHVDYRFCNFWSAVTRSVCDCLPVKFNRLSRRAEYVRLEPVQPRHVWAEFWLSRLRVILNGLTCSFSLWNFRPEFGSNCILEFNSRRELNRGVLLLIIWFVDFHLGPYAYLRDQDWLMLQASIVPEALTESAP